ncbi:F-box/kelch-repeat protein At3g23880-like [Papaver somniferum]|uniref:F-box/kelch-repeat protein At3g23880-like n=1 Tax=Papaver somniferum TaxID=3469 RepID=UPI000E700E9F|nr:F-box/kelch-repeat protein At3g23880-like [Papaver somniferum]
MGSALPEDVLFEIFMRLPVKSLLRFKSACKTWYALIESSDFIYRHANMTDYKSKLGTLICQFDTSDQFFVLSGDESLEVFEDLGNGPCFNKAYSDDPPRREMVASCHGIICIRYKKTKDIGLCNPATRQCRILPKPLSYGNLSPRSNSVGFGLDIVNKDYKVLLVTSFRQDGWSQSYPLDCVRKVQIYSLRSDSWRWIDGGNHFPIHCLNHDKGVYLNGNYFMIGLEYFNRTSSSNFDSDKVILSFDFNKEIFRKFLAPAGADYVRLCPQLYSVRDKLACTKSQCTRDGLFFEVWVLNDYNTKEECWTQLYRFRSLSLVYPFGPFALTRNGEFGFMITSSEVIKVYNFTTGEIEDPTSCLINTKAKRKNKDIKLDDGFNVYFYKEILVSIY